MSEKGNEKNRNEDNLENKKKNSSDNTPTNQKDKKDEIFKKLKENQKLIELDKTKEDQNIQEENKIETEKINKNIKKHPWQFYISISFVIFVIILFVINLIWGPKLTLKGPKEIELDYKEPYIEKGYKLIIGKKDDTKKVKIKGKVNTKKLGTYKIEYYYKIGIIKTTKRRTIKVVDKTKPSIILDGAKKIYICPNSEYEKKSYQAFDNYDGNITHKVEVTKKDDKYIYTVTDSSGNKSEVTRTIIKKDVIKPTITLKGDTVINLIQGQPYTESGYTALDNCDFDITNKVEIEGSVDTNTVGSYKIVYKVKDNASNEATITRTVNILQPSKNGVIYLTFDDGPKMGTTDVILNILKEEGIKATFFVTNNGPDELIKREFDEGHSIALHTASHNYELVYSSTQAYFADLENVQKRVENITGYKSMLIRFPGGSSNTISRRYKVGIMSELTKQVLEKGYKYYDWNISSGDAGEVTTSEGVYQNVIEHLSHDRVNMILMHDIKPYTRDAIRQIIKYGKENGYVFEKITNETQMVTQKVNN